MENKFSRTEMLIGATGLNRLAQAHIVVVGIGGVGSHVAEALTRSGIGKLTLIDMDVIAISNFNRQIHATTDTLGMSKVDAMKARILSINPQAEVQAIKRQLNADNCPVVLPKTCDFVVDAIDMVSAKLALIVYCKQHNLAIISSMGTGNKFDPCQLMICDIKKTHTDPLARVMRRELKKRDINHLTVVYSSEPPAAIDNSFLEAQQVARTPGSTAYVPPVAGFMIASYTIKKLLEK